MSIDQALETLADNRYGPYVVELPDWRSMSDLEKHQLYCTKVTDWVQSFELKSPLTSLFKALSSQPPEITKDNKAQQLRRCQNMRRDQLGKLRGQIYNIKQ